MPPLIHQMARPAAAPGCAAAVSSDTRAPPEPPVITAGVMSRCVSSPASASACMADSEEPSKHTSDSPQFGRSQISTRLPCVGQRLGQLAHAGLVLGEAAARA